MRQNGDLRDEAGGEDLISELYNGEQSVTPEAVGKYQPNCQLIRHEETIDCE